MYPLIKVTVIFNNMKELREKGYYIGNFEELFSSNEIEFLKNISDVIIEKFTKNDIETLQNINSALAKNNFDEAMNLVKVLKGNIGTEKNSLVEAIVDIVLWNKYSGKIDSKKTSFNDISTFVIDNPYLPNINDLRRNVERVAIANNVDYKIAEAYFNSNPALTTESKLYVVESKILKIATEKTDQEVRESQSKTIQSEIAKIWIKENFSVDSERQFIEKYKDILTESDHSQRIERLLWEGKKIEASRIMNHVGKDYRNLFESIAKIEESPRYIDNILLDIPRRLRSNELLTFKRLIWYKSKDRLDDIIDLLVDLPENYKLPEKWWSFRRLYGREMIKQKQFKKAYQILSKHNLPVTSNDFWEAIN